MIRSPTAALARYAAELRSADLPAAVTRKLQQLLLDCLGNQLGAYAEPQAQLLYDALDVATTAGDSTVVGFGTQTSALLAGCMNGMLAHLLDMDDAHRDSLTKTGSAITPAVMAIGEAAQASGADIVRSAAAGYEVMIRLGLAVNPGHRSRGFHSTATLGAFGAAVAAGCVLRLTPERMIDALGIAGTQCAGLTAFINNASMTKPLNVAKAVHSGILAARLAHQGYRGPPDVLEGAEGFFRAYCDAHDTDVLLDGLGERYRLLESGFKPHAACRYAHAPIDAAVHLMVSERLDAADIVAIEVYLSELANRQSNFYDPASVASAQGSTPFVIAASVAACATSLTVADVKHALSDPGVHALHRCVKLHVDPGMPYMGRGARVVIRLRDGRSHEHSVDLPRGEPENPMSDREIEQKFMRQAQAVVGAAQAQAIRDYVGALDTQPVIRDLMRLCVARNPRQRAA
jgi:2-methylcitrate dehydratase PrpD